MTNSIAETYGEAKDALEAQFEARKLAFAQTVPDFQQVVESGESIVIPTHVADFVRRSEGGVRVLYYLGKRQEFLNVVVALPPEMAIAVLRELEKQLTPPPYDFAWLFCWTPTPEETRAANYLAQLHCWDIKPGTLPN